MCILEAEFQLVIRRSRQEQVCGVLSCQFDGEQIFLPRAATCSNLWMRTFNIFQNQVHMVGFLDWLRGTRASEPRLGAGEPWSKQQWS